MSERRLLRTTRRLDTVDRATLTEGGRIPDEPFEAVALADGSAVDLTSVHALAAELSRRIGAGEWQADHAASDRWLAPWLHHCLRLDRRTAGDRAVWEWLACAVFQDYTHWRWAGEGGVADNRWFGPVNKQTLARLWWGAELFRNGPDYSRVEKVFVRQDFPNSLLHRPIVRFRPFALGIVDALFGGDDLPTADEVNDMARALNLLTAGSPPETQVSARSVPGPNGDWDRADMTASSDWNALPQGPSDQQEEPIRV